jgi:hypothetical protein
MKKILLSLGALAFLVLVPQISLAQAVNTYPNTAPEDAAKINDIQGQVNSSYFQNNSLKQDATGVSQNPDGAANILKNSNDSQSIKVTGPAPTEDSPSNNKDVPVIGLIIFLIIMIAPIVLIINMLKNNKKITTEESISYIAASYSQEDEDLTEAQIKELELVNSEALGNEPKKITEEPVEKLKKEVKKKQSKKSKKKSKKKKKR